MNRVVHIFVLVLMLLWPLGEGPNAADIRSAVRNGMKDLGAVKGETGLCVLTDATYVRVEGRTSEPLVDMIQEETGCTVGRGNLLFFHRPIDYPLKIAMFRKCTEECVVVSYEGKAIQSRKYDFAREVVAKSSFWAQTEGPLTPDEFAIVSFAMGWSSGAPYDLLKCAEFHNHLCPGIFAGYLIAQYVAGAYPVKQGEIHTWVASPPWCKDDALQMLLDFTAGKKVLYARDLTESQREELAFENPMGFLVIWNEEKNTGKGIVFRFDWDKVKNQDKLQMVLDLLNYVKKPEGLVGVVKECQVTAAMMEELKTTEKNPYRWLGLTK